ncbi:6723_t:CDS:2 [Funneliformis geosporum]|uniref:6723_t:CDS:1 n=1 Tax=Funneliformis geosporum TaxID=1117311 RepID=A0A9W4SZN9_9GLOM|nr:6723_t:CDS:2 [Funneliformis geosporum]
MDRKKAFEILGLTETASEKEIYDKYRQLAKKLHPDKNKGSSDATKKFQELSEAYEYLSSPKVPEEPDLFSCYMCPPKTMFCSEKCLKEYQKLQNGGYLHKTCKGCGGFHDNGTQIKCKIILEVFDELKYTEGMLEDFKQLVNRLLKEARKACEEKKNQIQQERKQCAEKLKSLQEKFIKENYDIPDDDELNELISETKKEENWNNFPNLKNLLTQIKSLQTSDSYNEHKAEIRAIEARLKELNPENFKNSIEKELEEKLKSNGLSKKDLSPENQEKFQVAVASNDIEKKQEIEEIIIEVGVKKELNETVTCIKKAITGQSNLTRTQKEELLNKLEKFIFGNAYQKKIYQQQKRKIDNLIIELRKEITNEQEKSEFA